MKKLNFIPGKLYNIILSTSNLGSYFEYLCESTENYIDVAEDEEPVVMYVRPSSHYHSHVEVLHKDKVIVIWGYDLVDIVK